MKIQTTRQINARTFDGREYVADKDTVTEIDDDDAGMVGLARSLIMSGQAEHYGDAGTLDGSEDAPAPEPNDPPAEDDLDALRADAEAAGVKVDGRWGADRLREEIDHAES